MEQSQDIPRQLKALREEAGLSVREMARRCGMSSSGYSHYEIADRFKDATLPLAQARLFAVAMKGTPVDPARVLALAGLGLTSTPKPTQPHGMDEAARPFSFQETKVDSGARNPHLRAIYGIKAATPETYEISIDLPAFSLVAGDVLLVDLGRLPHPGELAIVTIFEEQAATSHTGVYRYFPPYLQSGLAVGDTPPLRVDQSGVTVRHPVLGSLRGIPRK